MGLLGGSSKRLRNAVAAEDQTTMVRLLGEPDSLSFFSTAHNAGSAQVPKKLCVARRE
jgi:ATP adenylyltransferase/5',5'''-P-1,P-4-tetraphosphate phosphorylase II